MADLADLPRRLDEVMRACLGVLPFVFDNLVFGG